MLYYNILFYYKLNTDIKVKIDETVIIFIMKL